MGDKGGKKDKQKGQILAEVCGGERSGAKLQVGMLPSALTCAPGPWKITPCNHRVLHSNRDTVPN